MGPLKKALDAIKPSAADAGMTKASAGPGDDSGAMRRNLETYPELEPLRVALTPYVPEWQ